MHLTEGSTVVYAAICIPIFLLMFIFLMDATGSFVLRGRLQDIADASADAGMATLGDLIVKKAEAHDPNPPPNTDPLTMLTAQDLQALLVDPTIELAARDYVEKNKLALDIAIDTVDITYPSNTLDCFDPSNKSVHLTVHLSQKYPFTFPYFFEGKTNTTVNVDALQLMRLCL